LLSGSNLISQPHKQETFELEGRLRPEYGASEEMGVSSRHINFGDFVLVCLKAVAAKSIPRGLA
jgi:hypothetical protein